MDPSHQGSFQNSWCQKFWIQLVWDRTQASKALQVILTCSQDWKSLLLRGVDPILLEYLAGYAWKRFLIIIWNSGCSLVLPETHWLFFGSELSLNEFRLETQQFQMAVFLMEFFCCDQKYRNVLRENLLFHLLITLPRVESNLFKLSFTWISIRRN